MSKQGEDREGRGREPRGDEREAGGGRREQWLRALETFGALFVGVVVIGVVMASCAEQRGTDASSAAVTPEPAAQTVVATALPAPATEPEQPVRSGEFAVGSLPPDLSLAEVDTLVTPGQALEFVVEGTPDVASIALADGLGDTQPLVRAAGTNTWRVGYRVPLHPRHERYGVSLTAKNESGRWRRVWVFLHVAKPGAPEPIEASADSLPSEK